MEKIDIVLCTLWPGDNEKVNVTFHRGHKHKTYHKKIMSPSLYRLGRAVIQNKFRFKPFTAGFGWWAAREGG